MNYDIYNDVVFVVIEQEGSKRYLILNQAKIDYFYLGPTTFETIPDSTVLGLEGGIYEVVYEQEETSILIKNQKKRIQDLDPITEMQYRFDFVRDYYIIWEGEAHPANNKKEILALFADRPDILAYIKTHRLKFRAKRIDFEGNLVKLIKEFG